METVLLFVHTTVDILYKHPTLEQERVNLFWGLESGGGGKGGGGTSK